MRNINILTKCDDDNVRVAIIAAVYSMLNDENSNFVVNKLKRVGENAPVWALVSRQENLNNNRFCV